MSHYLRANRPGGVSATWTDDGGIVMPKEISDKVVEAFKEQDVPCSNPTSVAKETIPVVGENGEIVGRRYKQAVCLNVEKIAENHRKLRENEGTGQSDQQETPGVLYGQGLAGQLWLLLRPSGAFVKSTTEEGGESYIACTSFEEAQKVAEQQKIYDIECVPHRVF
jgi:hypothetical protein